MEMAHFPGNIAMESGAGLSGSLPEILLPEGVRLVKTVGLGVPETGILFFAGQWRGVGGKGSIRHGGTGDRIRFAGFRLKPVDVACI